jgi:omega-amidase
MQDLNITLIQTDLHWQNPEANRSMLEEKIWTIKDKTDVIVLPEMFSTGFTMNPAPVAEVMNLHSFKWMKQMATQTGAIVTGSYIVKDKDHFYNRLIWMQPDGHFFQYDKRHLFRMAGEHEKYAPGKDRLIVEWKGWKICPMICYDLRFPVWSRNVVFGNTTSKEPAYDLLLYVANWPEVRIHAWDQLLAARAIENLSYVAAVNRVGKDGNDISHNGHSTILSFKGEKLAFNEGENCILNVVLSKNELMNFREKFPAHIDNDQFDIL